MARKRRQIRPDPRRPSLEGLGGLAEQVRGADNRGDPASRYCCSRRDGHAKYGEENVRKYLKYELDRYLRGRAGDAPRAAALTSAARTLRVVAERRAGDVRAER